MRPLTKSLAATAALIIIATIAWAVIPAITHPQALAADLPPGALLTIESPDFAALLKSWNTSPEQTAWLKSANYSAFADSRLFSRLSDAQGEFEGVSGANTDFGSTFLQQVAGKESIFAWYDISKLEFLYISHLPPGHTANVELLKQRGHFSRRESGGTSFYIKTSTGGSDGPSSPRTIAFATRGDWLILATREDLIANALLLMQNSTPSTQSEAAEGWYTAAEAAGPTQHGDLHMLLDLQRITAEPTFHTYWIQRNVTDTHQYRAAVADLYRDPHAFREERVLLPNTTTADTPPQPDLSTIEAFVPDRAGVYRATASPQPDAALATLDEKLLTRAATSTVHDTAAPVADLSTPHPGSASDLETRIDTVSSTPEPASAATAPLLAALQSASLTAMLTIDRTDPPAPGDLFIPIRSAVILRSTNPWNTAQLQSALLTALRSHLTVGTLGLAWSPSGEYLSLGSTRPFALFVDGNTAILANNPALMNDILATRIASLTLKPQPATLIAGFRHAQERSNFAHLTASLAHTATPQTKPSNADPDDSTDTPGDTPDFFNANIGSFSNAFRALATERFVERRDGPLTHQTVVYIWQTK